MKHITKTIAVFFAAALFSSCFTTKALEKPAYINNDVLHISGEKLIDVSMFAISMSGDKNLYTDIVAELGSFFGKKNIQHDSRFFDATENPTTVGTAIRESKRPYYLILDRVRSDYQKDEMNNSFITNQMNVIVQKNSGEHIADFTITLDRTTFTSKMAKNIVALITDYLQKKNLVN